MSMISLLSPTKTFNPAIASDSYKDGHFRIIQKFPDILKLMFYQEARGGEYQKVVQATMQMMLKMFFSKPMTHELVDEAEDFSLRQNGSFNRKGWDEIVEKYDGRFPFELWALPEGTVVPVSCPLSVHWNTGGNSTAWVPGFFETLIQRYSWVGTTVATNSYYTRRLIEQYMRVTDDDATIDASLDVSMLDFGSRGTKEPLFTGGGFLLSFLGTDNKEAVYAMNHAYNTEMAGFSIPYASEHSQMTLLGEDGEFDVVDAIIDEFGPEKCIIAMVIDAYSQSKFLKKISSGKYREKIMRYGELGSTFIFRPDSGIPEENYPKVIKELMDGFGYTTTSKGFDKPLPFIRALQGDAVNRKSLPTILESLIFEKIAISSGGFGSGGGALEQFDRDTLKYAMKLCAEEVANVGWVGRNKCPEDAPWKASKAGRVGTYWKADEVDAVAMSVEQLMALPAAEQAKYTNAMVPFYRNGEILVNEDLATIRKRLYSYGGTIFA